MSFDLGAVTAKVDLDITGFRKGIQKAEGGIKNFATKLDSVGDSLKRTGQGMSLFLTTPILGAGTAAVKSAADFEQLEVALGTILGSQEKANELLAEMQEFAAGTPFEFTELANSTKQLLAYGFAQEEILDVSRTLGDVAAGLNIPFGDLAYLYGTLRAQQVAYTKDINQFANRGIPIWQELANVLGKSVPEVRDLVQEGEIGFPIVEKAFRNMTGEAKSFSQILAESTDDTVESLGETIEEFDNLQKAFDTSNGSYDTFIQNLADSLDSTIPETLAFYKEMGLEVEDFPKIFDMAMNSGGQFHDLMSKQSETTAGQFSNLKDSVGFLARDFGELLIPIAQELIDKLRTLVDWVNGLTEEQKKTILIIGAVIAAIGPFLIVLGTLASGISAVITIVGALGIALKFLAANPIVLLIGAIVLLAYLIYKNWEQIKAAFELGKIFVTNIMNRIVGFLKNIGGKIKDALISPFTAAWDKIKETVNKIKDALDFTKRQSPSVVDVVNRGVSEVNKALGGLEYAGSMNPAMAAAAVTNNQHGPSIFNVKIDLGGAVIADEFSAERMGAIIGDGIIDKLKQNVRF